MPVTQQEQTKVCEVSLEIEVEPGLVRSAIDEAYKEAGATTAVPGFRKGKAPRAVLERYVSEERVLARAADKLAQSAYERALEETGIKPFGEAEYEVVQLRDAEPFVFKAKVPLEPTVELGDYVGVEAERLVRQVPDEEVEEQVRSLAERRAEVSNVEGRPVQQGDLVVATVTEPDGETRESVFEVGKNLPSFDEGLIGMEIGQTKTVQLEYPEDFEDRTLAGRSDSVTVTVSSIKERHVPELTDEFVRQLNIGEEPKPQTVDELRSRVRTVLQTAADVVADQTVESEIVHKIVECSKVCFPDAMVEHEVAHRLSELVEELGSKKLRIEDYLRAEGTTFEELRSRIEQRVRTDLKATLVLLEVAKRESIEVTNEEVEEEISKLARESKVPAESVKAYLDKTGGRRRIEGRLLRRKVLDFLVHASNITHVGRAAS